MIGLYNGNKWMGVGDERRAIAVTVLSAGLVTLAANTGFGVKIWVIARYRHCAKNLY